MPGPDWRCSEHYAELKSLDAPGFAWQFLSRNPEFRQEHQRLTRLKRRGTLTLEQTTAFAERWGARFPGRGPRAGSRAADMDAGGFAERRAADGFAVGDRLV